MANDSSSEFLSFLADDEAAVHAMMKDAAADNATSLRDDDATVEDDDDSCGVYNWPILFLFTIVIAAIGTTQHFVNCYAQNPLHTSFPRNFPVDGEDTYVVYQLAADLLRTC